MGDVFLHGLFFAHETEENNLYTGSVGPFYKNPSKNEIMRQWFRLPEIDM